MNQQQSDTKMLIVFFSFASSGILVVRVVCGLPGCRVAAQIGWYFCSSGSFRSMPWHCGCAMVIHGVCIVYFSVFCFRAHTEFNTIVICCVLCVSVVFSASCNFCGPGKSRALWYNNTGGKHTCRIINNTFCAFLFDFNCFFLNYISVFFIIKNK